MNIFDFLQWVLSDPWRTFGLCIVMMTAGLSIGAMFPTFKRATTITPPALPYPPPSVRN